MRRMTKERQRHLVASKVLFDVHWAYAVLAGLTCYSALVAMLLWSLFR